jgi:hypothetical protein
VAAEGCTPAEAVVRRPARLAKANLAGLRALARSSSGGVGMLRGFAAESVPAVRPLSGSMVLTRRPTLSWPAVDRATAYDVRLFSGQGRERRLEWKASSTEPRLPYPEKQPPLPPGVVRYWEVTARTGDDQETPAVQSRFSVATAREIARLAKIRPLAESRDPNDWLVAAAAYEAAGVYNEALPLYEKLAAKRPGQPRYQEALARYYARAGLPTKAEQARRRAEELGAGAGQK